MFSHKIITATILGVVAVSSVPSTAQNTFEVQSSIEVQANDLDLSSEAGQRTLDMRLTDAVRKVCGPNRPVRELGARQNQLQCAADARQSFKEQRRIAISNAQSAERMAVREARSSNAG
ncbi:MAG: UrcA family protein [Pseudomonadota bacterium]